MSRPGAAALTAALMSRKGAAQPSRLYAVAAPVAAPVPATRPQRPAAPPAKDRRRITLRLDPERHTRLKLAAAHLDLSLQGVLIAALDSHLARQSPCACLASETR